MDIHANPIGINIFPVVMVTSAAMLLFNSSKEINYDLYSTIFKKQRLTLF
jgi:hypothetical protein